MTAIERTAYPRFTRAPSIKELGEIYTPTPANVAFVSTKARGPAKQLALMILLKVYERLHYFPDPQSIPRAARGWRIFVAWSGRDSSTKSISLTA